MSDSNSSVEVVQEKRVKDQSNNNKRKQPEAKQQTKDIGNERVLNLSKLFRRLFDKKEMLISMVGLEGAGKTTILYKLGQNVSETSSSGLNMETVRYKNITFNAWDVGVRHEKTRPQWRNYFRDTKGLIFVADITDRDGVVEARDELHRILNEESLNDAVVLVFANKQDLPNAMTSAEITENLGLSYSSSLRQSYCRVQITCATSGEGLQEGLDWLSTTIGFRTELEWIRINSAKKAYGGQDLAPPGYVFRPTHQHLIDILVRLIDGKIITWDRVNRVNIFTNHPALVIRNLSSKLHSYEHDSQRHYLFYCKVPDNVECSGFGYDDFRDEAKEGVWELTKAARIINCNLPDGRSLRGEIQTFHYNPIVEATGSWMMDMYGLADFPHPKSNMVICNVFENPGSENAKAVRSVLDGKRDLLESLKMKSRHDDEIQLLEERLREERRQRYSARAVKIKLKEMALREERMKRDSCCLDIAAKTRLLVKEMKKQKRIEQKEADAIEPPDRKRASAV